MRVMECCIKKIWRWRIQDRLLVNDDKTEFRIIGTRQQFRKLQAINIKVGSSEKKTNKSCRFQKCDGEKPCQAWVQVPDGTCPFGNLRQFQLSLVKTPFLFRWYIVCGTITFSQVYQIFRRAGSIKKHFHAFFYQSFP